jgi:hypothetical protein
LYLDVLHDIVESRSKLPGAGGAHDQFVPTPFYPFESPGEYNGMLLKPGLVQTIFLRVSLGSRLLYTAMIYDLTFPMNYFNLQVMTNLETYLQNSFQMHPDEREWSDPLFKFADMLFAAIRAGKVFTATYDSISLAGKANFNRLVHTKSNDEIRPLIQDYKEVRINNGATRTEGDGGPDQSLWPEVFPELLEKAQKPRPRTQEGIPKLGVGTDYQDY